MTDGAGPGGTPGLTDIRLDRQLLAWAEILVGAGAVLWTAGFVVAFAAFRRAAQDWFEQLDQNPTQLAASKWQQIVNATTAGANAYRSSSKTQA